MTGPRLTPEQIAELRAHYDNQCQADEIARAELRYHDPRPGATIMTGRPRYVDMEAALRNMDDPECQEWLRHREAVSGGLLAFNRAHGLELPTRRQRNDIADLIWRKFRPDSKYGRDEAA